MDALIDPIVLFFVLGVCAGALKSDLKLPESLYESLSIYLLLAIGLKGGVELSKTPLPQLGLPLAGALSLGVSLPLVAYALLRRLGKFSVYDSAALAAHYGSVSAVTFAVVLSYLHRIGAAYESYVTLLLVVMEVPAIVVGILLAKMRRKGTPVRWSHALREVFLGKSIFLLLGGLIIGAVCGPAKLEPFRAVFIEPFKGALAFFLLEMGLIASRRLGALRSAGPFLICFGVGMPLLAGAAGAAVGVACGMSAGGAAVLAVLSASASYIAAPAAVRVAIPEANPSLYLTASLGVTFPFNILFGVPLYYSMAAAMHAAWGNIL